MKRYFLQPGIHMLSVSWYTISLLTAMIPQRANAENTTNFSGTSLKDSLPNVWNAVNGARVETALRDEAHRKSRLYQLPKNKNDWMLLKASLKKRITGNTAMQINHQLPLNIRVTGSTPMKGYVVKNIAYQTRPEVYATANLYVPEGTGRFPSVIVMMGHSLTGRLYDKYQEVGATLAVNGYVALCVDPWGAGERTTEPGVFEDHGDENNLGFALMNIGESLMGMQLTDNIRGVDLLCSLSYVDKYKIGATGSSGGGNQTIWLAAMDERIKAAVPVVSAGTYESFVMGSPCICEVLTDALTFTEEAAVLAMTAPRAIKMCNHGHDANAAFNPREMLRSYNYAKPVFSLLGAENNIAYDTFNLTHGYWPEDRASMLGWLNQHLKGTGTGKAVKELPFEILPNEKIMVYPKGERDKDIVTTAIICRQRGEGLREELLSRKSIDAVAKRRELKSILRLGESSTLKNVQEFPSTGGWKRFALLTSDNKSVPVLIYAPSDGSKQFIILSNTGGKGNIPSALIDSIKQTGCGIAITDLSGTGELSSEGLKSFDSTGRLRVLSKSYLLLGKTVTGEWVKELGLVTEFISSRYKPAKITMQANKEAGLAALFLAALQSPIENFTIIDAPVSYLFDNRDSIEYFSTAVNLPGILKWGDVSLATAISGKNITFIHPVTMSGAPVEGDKLKAYEQEFEQMRVASHQAGKTMFY